MTVQPGSPSDDALAARAKIEARLQVLHDLRPEARLHPGFEAHYVGFVRSLREQLHPRGVRNIRTVQLPSGLAVQVDLGDRLGCDVFYGYYDERFEASLFVDVLRPGGIMFDVGANFGYYAVHCARAVGESGAVHAFEPDPAAADLLAANTTANGLDGTLTRHAVAISDADGEVEYHLAEEAAFSGMTSTGRSAVRDVVMIPTRSLDSIASEYGIQRLDALKIDVEGHEAAVLRGAADLLSRSPDPLVMLEVSAKNLTDAARLELIAALGRLFATGYHGLTPDLSADGGLRAILTADEAASLPAANLLLLRPNGPREARVREIVAERLAEVSPLLGSHPADEDARPIHLVNGLDPDLVSAALRDKADAEAQAATLAAAARELRQEIGRLKAERAALRAEVRRLGSTPIGLAVRAARRLARSLPTGRR